MANKPCKNCGSSDARQSYSDGDYCFSCHTKVFRKGTSNSRIHKPICLEIGVDDEKHYPTSRHAEYGKLTAAATKYLAPLSEETQRINNIIFLESVELYSYNFKKWYTVHDVVRFEILDCERRLIGYEYRCFTGTRKTLSDYPPGSAFYSEYGKMPYRIITEDILSAMKVGVQYYSAALLGTSLPKRMSPKLMGLLQSGESFLVWLDGDSAGQAAAKKVITTLQQFAPCVNIKTHLDPKYYSPDEITEIVTWNLSGLFV